jgi:predicted DNA-binding protein
MSRTPESPPLPPSRAGTVTITAHMPKETRDRLKIMAVRLGRTMNELMGEALEDLFRKHGDEKTVDRP